MTLNETPMAYRRSISSQEIAYSFAVICQYRPNKYPVFIQSGFNKYSI